MKLIWKVLLLVLLYSCNSSYEYWDLDHFKFQKNALKDGESIRLLYSSRAPDYKNKDYYIHYVVVSDDSGDTVNILSNLNYHLTNNEDGLNYVFHSDEERMGKMLELDLDEFQNTALDTNLLNSINVKKCDKVIRDIAYDFIADNKFPTVKGKILKKIN